MAAVLVAERIPFPFVGGTVGREPDDRELALRLRAGDERALARGVQEHGSLVGGRGRRVTGDAGAAEDVSQEVFVALWTRPDRFDPDLGSLRTFLAVLARRRAIDWLRRQDRARRRYDALAGSVG